MWKYIYMFNSYDLTKSGSFYPSLDRNHKDWVIPPSRVDRVRTELLFT